MKPNVDFVLSVKRRLLGGSEEVENERFAFKMEDLNNEIDSRNNDLSSFN